MREQNNSKSDMFSIYREYIKKIANHKSITHKEIKRHILKHAKEDMLSHPKEWAASMHNLLNIFEVKMRVKPTTELKINRLLRHHFKHKKEPVPPKQLNNKEVKLD